MTKCLNPSGNRRQQSSADTPGSLPHRAAMIRTPTVKVKLQLCTLDIHVRPTRLQATTPNAVIIDRIGERHASACRYKNGSSTNEVRGDIRASNVLAPLVLRLSLKGSRISAWGKRIRECG